MLKLIFCTLVASAVALCTFPAVAQKAYKQVDEKGNVTYSQTPPVQGKEAKKVDISPAQAGRGGPAGSTDTYRIQRTYTYEQPNQQAYQKQREEAEQKRIADLKAECNRNRGADCNNPETLRLMEAQKIPGGRYYPPR
jgi:uncharacterized protein DUF4124